MSEPGSQKPKEGASTGLKPVTIGLALGAAALGWMVFAWLDRVWP